MPSSFRHLAPPLRLYFGEDSLAQLPGELDRLGCRRAVVFCGRTLAGHPDGLPRVVEALHGRCAGVFDQVRAHSPLPQVLAGSEALRRLNADAAVALGGGSAMVTARAASILFAEGSEIEALCTRFTPSKPPESPRLVRPKLPQFVVPTTPTTAYAKAGAAVLDPAQKRRLALFDPKTRAAALFIDPVIAGMASRRLVLAAGLEAFASAVQGIESPVRDPLADALLVHALHLLNTHLPRMMSDTDDAETRGQLMLGALLAGQGTDYAPAGLASAVSHCLGARLGLDNGITISIVLPHAMRFNASATEARLPLIASALGTTDAITAVEALLGRLGIPRRLRDIEVPRDSLPLLAEDIAGDWFLYQNPRHVTGTAELVVLLEAAW